MAQIDLVLALKTILARMRTLGTLVGLPLRRFFFSAMSHSRSLIFADLYCSAAKHTFCTRRSISSTNDRRVTLVSWLSTTDKAVERTANCMGGAQDVMQQV